MHPNDGCSQQMLRNKRYAAFVVKIRHLDASSAPWVFLLLALEGPVAPVAKAIAVRVNTSSLHARLPRQPLPLLSLEDRKPSEDVCDTL